MKLSSYFDPSDFRRLSPGERTFFRIVVGLALGLIAWGWIGMAIELKL